MIQRMVKSWFLACTLALLTGCAMFAAYNSLSPDEKAQYQGVADQMTTTQKMHYLEIKEPQERQAYLKSLNLQEPAPSAHGHGSVEHASLEKVAPPAKPKKIAEETIAPEQVSIKPAKIAPAAIPSAEPAKKSVQVAEASSGSVARVKYAKTGDPITDVLILLDLYEKGKISKSQFEHEKELALQKNP